MSRKLAVIILFVILTVNSCTQANDVKKAKKYIEDKKYLEAISILEGGEKNAMAYFLLGEAYRGLRKFSLSDSFYNVSLQKNPGLKSDIIKAYSATALTDFMKGFNYNAITYWEKILDLDPNYDINIGYYYLGKHYYEQEKVFEAKPLLLNAVSIELPSKSRINTFRMIIDIYRNEEKFDTAYIYVKMARDEFGLTGQGDHDFSVDMGDIVYNIAMQYFRENDFNEAINLVNEFIAIGKPKSLLDDAYLLLGDIYFELKDYHKAIPAYNKVKELNDVKVYGSRDTYVKANDKLRKIAERTVQ